MLQSEGWEWSHLPGSEALSHEVDGSQEWASRGAKDRASAAAEFVSPDIERFYFGRAKEYVAANLVKDSLRDVTEPPVGVQKGAVIDLPSFPDARTSRIVLSSIVDAVWRRARHDWAKAFDKSAKEDERVPVFLVIEEAHNIIPAEPQSSSAAALRDQIRTIAAEGRKYGVFLILVTQRPDKIDPLVVSECENRAVMRIAKSAEEITTKLLSLEQLGADMLSRLASLQQGRFVLVGPWASSSKSTIGLAAMRRTEEGGRSLRPEHWAQPEPIVPKPAKVSPKAPPAKTGKH
jgi:DNA helicase HerA-like ATPase